MSEARPLVFLADLLLVKEYATYVKFHTGSEIIWDKPEHDPLNNNNYIYIFRNIKTPNYMSFFFCVYVSFINHECLYC